MVTRKVTFWSMILLCLLLPLFCAGCGAEGTSAKRGDILHVATATDFPPFEYTSQRHKGYQGFDMDLIRAIGEEMGREVDISAYDFDKLLTVLEEQKADVVIAALSVNEERRKVVAFTKPYYHSGLSLVVRYDNRDIKDFNDLKGRKVAVMTGTTAAHEMKKIVDVEIKEVTNLPDLFMELSIGNVDAVVNDRPVNDYYIHSYGMAGVKSLNAMLSEEEYAIAVQKDNRQLLQEVDAALKALHANGSYAGIYAKWFGK